MDESLRPSDITEVARNALWQVEGSQHLAGRHYAVTGQFDTNHQTRCGLSCLSNRAEAVCPRTLATDRDVVDGPRKDLHDHSGYPDRLLERFLAQAAASGGCDQRSVGGTDFGLEGGLGADSNHAKIGVSISNAKHLAIYGDMNQEGSTTDNCARSQNGRGGLFFVVDDQALSTSITALIDGDTAPTKAPTAQRARIAPNRRSVRYESPECRRRP